MSVLGLPMFRTSVKTTGLSSFSYPFDDFWNLSSEIAKWYFSQITPPSDLVDFYHTLSSAVCFCLFILFSLLCLGSSFCRLDKSYFLLFVKSVPHGWGWTSSLWRFSGWEDLFLWSGGWSWILSFKRQCHVQYSFVVCMDVVLLCAVCFLMSSLCSCFAEGLAWSVQQCSLLALNGAWS